MTSSKTIKQLEAEIKELKAEGYRLNGPAIMGGIGHLYEAVVKIAPEEWEALLVGTPRALREKIEAVRNIGAGLERSMREADTVQGQIGDLERAIEDLRGANRMAV